MSDDLKDDYPGATKGVFASVGVMLLLVGGDMMAVFFYAAAFWRTARKVLSSEAQFSIARFAASYITWAFILFLLLQTLILSRFVEQHRWPFSYPVDPTIYAENSSLHQQVQDLNKQAGELSQMATK
jgi:hypothetical protein